MIRSTIFLFKSITSVVEVIEVKGYMISFYTIFYLLSRDDDDAFALMRDLECVEYKEIIFLQNDDDEDSFVFIN